MKIDFLAVIVVSSFLLLSALCVSVRGAEDSSPRSVEHVRFLSGLGPRLAGTEAENLAVSYISQELASYGLEVEVENFVLQDAYVYKGGKFGVTTPISEEVESIPFIRSPPTQGVLVDNLVYLGDSSENIQPWVDDIVLVSRRNFLRFREDSPNAFIVYEENRPAWSHIYRVDSLKSPSVTISSEDAKRLIDLTKSSQVKVKLDIRAEIDDRTSHNVVATLPGKSEERVVVAAHHDSVLTPGAVDDSTGVAVLLEVARELSDEQLPRTVSFVSFGSEEYGTVGSEYHVRNLENIELVTAVLDVDSICPGSEDGLRIGVEGGSSLMSTVWLGQYVRNVAVDMSLKPSSENVADIGGYSDYYSYVRKGVPATWILWVSGDSLGLPWPIHTIEDNLSNVDENLMEQVVDLTLLSVRKLSKENISGGGFLFGYSKEVLIFSILFSVTFISVLFLVLYRRYVVNETGESDILGFVVLYVLIPLSFCSRLCNRSSIFFSQITE